MATTATDLRREADSLSARLTAWRRDLHAHPELGFAEHRTAGMVVQILREVGCEVRTGLGQTGVAGLLRGGLPGPTVMLRADMDALPIQEISDAPYASTEPGAMHACGHDGHVAMALGAATLLAQGAGRLIRSATDRDVVAVLDPRLSTKPSYRWQLIHALPPMKRTKDFDEVAAFLAALGTPV